VRLGHFFSGATAVLACGYFARSSRHFFTSSGWFVAVYSSTSRSSAFGVGGGLVCGVPLVLGVAWH
jgi:hypothetical protein